jgi:hypothetical protein
MYGVNITNIHTYLLGLLLQISHDKSICFKEEAAQKKEVSEVGQVTKEFGTGAAEIIQAEILRLLQQKVSY